MKEVEQMCLKAVNRIPNTCTCI